VQTVTATLPTLEPPTWAILERRLFELLDESIDPFLDKYVNADGTLHWADRFPGRDGGDDFYESCYNWPLAYLLGGSERLQNMAEREWDAITRQLTKLGHVSKEYEIGYDWFHQGEANLYFYFLCLAHPNHPENAERARRFAGLYLNDDPGAPNFDSVHRIIRAPHNGSQGPRWGFFDGEPSYGWSASMARYGLPFEDIPGIRSYDDLRDPDRARQMGQAMQSRHGRGDVVSNLLATSLVTNAYLASGDTRYREWVLDYVDAWVERARQNGGLIPDNVGLSGRVGEYLDGKWYGGLYGWSWPHGFYNIAMATIVAAENAYLLTGDSGYLELPRDQIDRILELGSVRDVNESPMSLREHWVGQFPASAAPEASNKEFLVPYRHADSGWFDYQPMAPMYPTAVWHRSLADPDWERLERLRLASSYDWRAVHSFRTKEDAGHEAPWLRFLAGDNPTYPEQILTESLGQVSWRLDQIRADQAELATVNIHHWQQLNPVLTEGLLQLTLGAPSPIYNGGLLFAPLRYFDSARDRPGLPPDVAALVRRLTAEGVTLDLINLSGEAGQELVIQAGAFAEHEFEKVRFGELGDSKVYPGPLGAYRPPTIPELSHELAVNDRWLKVALPPGNRITLDVTMRRFVHQPTSALPRLA
jgi:hypothetical protein